MALIQSYGLESRIVPDKLNVLCPNIFNNCCTAHDQMKIHKIWRDATKPRLKAREAQFKKKWDSLKVLVDNIDHIDFDYYTTLFTKQAQNPVDSFLSSHLFELSFQIKQNFEVQEIKDFIDFSLRLQIKIYYKNLQVLRQSNLCLICDYESQKFINVEINQITYKKSFCTKLTDKFLKFHDDKYNKVIKFFMLVDEWVSLTSDRILFLEGDKEIFRRYLLAIEKCKGGGCNEYCSEYNVNELNYLYDGEVETFDELEKNLTEFLVDIQRNSKKYFSEYNHKWDFQSFMSYRKYESVLETFDEDYPRLHSDEFTGVTLLPSKSFFERIHKINSLEIETLDDTDDMIQLFRQQNHPIDLSEFLITVDDEVGIDLFDLARYMQIQITPNKFMALLNFKTTISRHIPEILTKRTKAVLNAIKLTDVIQFKRDFKMKMKFFRPKSSTASAAGFFPRRRGVSKMLFQLKTMIVGKPPYPHPSY